MPQTGWHFALQAKEMTVTSRYGPPLDLSALPNFQQTDARPRCLVFVGRVSTKDNQNPATSIPRQVSYASDRLESGEGFAAYFWDVESGMLPPELRGLAPQEMYDALRVPVRRDGGLQDLVDRAEQLGVTHVLAERSDRVARAMLTSLTVEHELGRIGVEVVYANEPVGGTESGRLRTRRYSQVDAEIYRTTMLEMSMGGQVQHAVQGWNHGHPPYPYVAVIDENAPERHGGRFGTARPKKKLVPHPDPRRFDAAREMFRLRQQERRRTVDIIEALAAEPDRYPIDGRWTRNLVDGLLANPKLAGHQVYNRKATRTGREGRSRWNPITEWVWSPTVVHEPVVTMDVWRSTQEITEELRAEAGGPMLRIQAAARQVGLTVTEVSSSGTHTVFQIGDRRVVLPARIPETIVEQVIADMRSGL